MSTGPPSGEIPTQAGVYHFRDEDRRVLYVGKAKNLRQRLNSYFADPAGLHPRTFRDGPFRDRRSNGRSSRRRSRPSSSSGRGSDEFIPRFNVMFRDDKSYPYLAITTQDRVPRVYVTRGKRRKGVTYFGPFGQAWAIRESLDLLLRVFPIRTCTSGVFKRAERSGRPCLLGYIDKVLGPLRRPGERRRASRAVRSITDFMSGSTGTLI